MQLLPLWLSAVYSADQDADANRDLDTAAPHDYSHPDATVRRLLRDACAQAAHRATSLARTRGDLYRCTAPADSHAATHHPATHLPDFADQHTDAVRG